MKRFTADTEKNRKHDFLKCTNHSVSWTSLTLTICTGLILRFALLVDFQPATGGCNFWHWMEKYVVLLQEKRVVPTGSQVLNPTEDLHA